MGRAISITGSFRPDASDGDGIAVVIGTLARGQKGGFQSFTEEGVRGGVIFTGLRAFGLVVQRGDKITVACWLANC